MEFSVYCRRVGEGRKGAAGDIAADVTLFTEADEQEVSPVTSRGI